MAIINASAIDFIPFQEGESTVQNPAHAVDLLEFTESVYCPLLQAIASETILFTESAHINDLNASASDSLSFVESAARGATASAFDLFGTTDSASLFHGGPGNDSINFADLAGVVKVKPGLDTLVLTESATSKTNPFLSFADTLVFYDFARSVKVTCAPIDQRIAIQLSHPTTNPTRIVTLCVPEFGDARRRDFQRINRRSRGNDLVVYRDPSWIVSDHFTMKLANLNAQQKNDLIDFLEFTTGEYVLMRDYENNIWKGFIMNPNTPLVQTGSCTYECELQFSGAIITPAGN